MPLKKYRPTSPGRRNMTTNKKEMVTASTPEKSLLVKKHSQSGSAINVTAQFVTTSASQTRRQRRSREHQSRRSLSALVEAYRAKPRAEARCCFSRKVANSRASASSAFSSALS